MTEFNGITGLLDIKVQECTARMKERMELDLWGNEPYTYSPTTYSTGTSATWQSIVDQAGRHLKKENPMSTTEAAVAKARAEANEKKAKRLIADIEREIGQFAPLHPGTFITARVEYADNDTVYRYAWIKGEKEWFRTYSTRKMTTEQVVDELVQLVLDANSVEWEIVGAGS